MFSARHLAKALYAFAPPGGIWTADDLVEFAAAVNAGETLAPWQNEEGAVVLLDDIDMTGVTTWTPIGDATFALASNALTISSGRPFTGFFDGQDHTISNFRMVCDNATPNRAWGLFGALGPGAVVENLVFDSSCSLEITASKATDCGILAGLVYDAAVRNVTNEAPMSFDGSAGNVRMTMGMIGLAFANEGIVLDRLTNEADLTAENGGNSKSDATGVQIGGICGFSTNHASSANAVAFTACVNRGNLTTKVGRASGIVAAANRYTHLTDCANYGNNFNEFATAGGARIGNITCITGTGAKFTKVVNRGDVICKNEGCCGSIVCLVNHDDNEFVGCENYGRVISDRDNNKYKGSFFGQCNKAAVFRNCIAQGDVGTYNDGNYVMVGINADNYMDYLGTHSAAAVNVTRENMLYYPAGSTTPAEATFNVAPGSVGLNALGTDAAVVSLSAADYDWTVSTGGSEWVKVTDLNDTPLAAGTKSPYVQQIRITADVNPQTEPRSATVTFASTDLTQTATVSVTQEAAGPAFPSQWIFSASTVGQYNTPWSVSNMLPATSGSSGYISVVRGEANAGREFTRTVNSYKPAVSTMVEGDYWLYTLPVKRLEAGTAVEFDATMAGEANSPKYFIVEYLDGGVWKSVEEDLLTAPEDPSIRSPTSARAQPREAATSTPASCRPSVSPIPSRERCRSAAAPWDVTPAREVRRTSRRAVRRAYCRRSDSRAPMSRTSARRSRATRRRCSASATRSPITAIRRGCSKRSPGTRDITSMSKGTSRVRRISGSIWSCRSRPTPSTSEATITPSFRTRARIPRPTGATAQRR